MLLGTKSQFFQKKSYWFSLRHLLQDVPKRILWQFKKCLFLFL